MSGAEKKLGEQSVGSETDEALLRRFEPVARYTKGDRFFPMDAELYVRACSLWAWRPGEEEEVCLIPHGKLTLEELAEPQRDGFGTVHYLKFTDPREAKGLIRQDARRARESRGEGFRAGRGRLARVGYVSRIMDTLFSLTLLARGRVPGSTAAAGRVAYSRILAENEHYSYHGRVVRQDGWIVLQYWFLYAFNDWRSGFFGANDHEADWEKVFVYLSESPSGELAPRWTAYSSHNYEGDVLRRRWDDPELEKVGKHPVIHVCAGSHSNQYAAGEYLTELELSFLAPLTRVLIAVRTFWRRTLRQYEGDEAESGQGDRTPTIFRIPFVDYARGDGLTIGPGQEREWDPSRLLGNPIPNWALNYRGLWGLYTRDPFAGEDAPAGPMYNRDGSVARPWYDPVGWAGLDKVPPPTETLHTIEEQQAALEARRAALQAEVEEKSRQLKGLGVEAAATRGQPHLRAFYEEHREQIRELSIEVDRLRARVTADGVLLESLESYAERLRAGEEEPARAHILRAQQPASETRLRASRLAEAWAAASVGLMLIVFVPVVIYERGTYLTFALAAVISLFLFVEAGFRGRLTNLVTSASISLAVIAALVVFYRFFWEIVVASVLILGVYILWDNLRELRR
ncbi:MAG: hypothetical protein LC740_01830 [Actinobacteria bacterium]|nr:hypothetical protein [Actinomycetota bacterium]